MLIETVPLWFAQTNAYVVAAEHGGPAVLIDAPPDPDSLLEQLKKHDLAAVALLITHGHVDHVGGAGQVVRQAEIRAYVHPADDFLTLDPDTQLRGLFGMLPPGDYAPPARFESLADGQRLELAGLTIDVIHTPGHTPGHCCFLTEGTLFSGDQLFAGSIGRTDLPGGDYGALMDSMARKILPLADELIVLPGHGPRTTLGRERRTNPFLSNIA
ncbi:MAG: MBL fold metallo-hydrolase [Acidimicrobiia bacterium]